MKIDVHIRPDIEPPRDLYKVAINQAPLEPPVNPVRIAANTDVDPAHLTKATERLLLEQNGPLYSGINVLNAELPDVSHKYPHISFPEQVSDLLLPANSDVKTVKHMLSVIDSVPKGRLWLEKTRELKYPVAISGMFDGTWSARSYEGHEPGLNQDAMTSPARYGAQGKSDDALVTQVTASWAPEAKKNPDRYVDAVMHLFHEITHVVSKGDVDPEIRFNPLSEEFQAYALGDQFYGQLLERFPLQDPKHFQFLSDFHLRDSGYIDINGLLIPGAFPYAPRIGSLLDHVFFKSRAQKHLTSGVDNLPKHLKLGALPFETAGGYALILTALQSFDTRWQARREHGGYISPDVSSLTYRSSIEMGRHIDDGYPPESIHIWFNRFNYGLKSESNPHPRAQMMRDLIEAIDTELRAGRFAPEDVRALADGLRLPEPLSTYIDQLGAQ